MAGKAEPKTRKVRLKVFRTPIGFHDAYVAAPSRKAALAAWGTEKDLFARGVAEEVTDPELMAEPLSAPGTVFRQLRSIPADEVDAKPPKTGKPKASGDVAPKRAMRRVPPRPSPPRPSEQDVSDAQRALDTARKQHQAEQRDLAARERQLAAERRALEARQAKELRLLDDRLETAQQDYEARLQAWRKGLNKAKTT